MHDLEAYLRKPAVFELFGPQELSEPLISVYNYARAALREHCDRIIVDHDSVTLSGDGQGRKSAIGIDLRDQFVQVLRRDPVMAAHLELLERTPQHTTYRIARHQGAST